MSDLPSGLASISARLDDSPQVRGAVAFGRMVREREGGAANDPSWVAAADVWVGIFGEAFDREGFYRSIDQASLTSAIDRHAALAVSAGYRSADRR